MADTSDSTDQWEVWRGRVSAARARRDQRIGEWQGNVNARKGMLAHTGDATTQTVSTLARATISVNQDWPLTKAKIAQLYSQTPEVRLSPRTPQLQQAVPIFGAELNETITQVDVGATIEEVLADVINASGIGGALVSCEIRSAPKAMPMIDPAQLPPEAQAAVQSGQMQIPTQAVNQTTDIRYLVQRISPADLLIPDDFTGSNYDQARWLGEEGRMTWTQAQANLGLTDEQKPEALGRDRRSSANQSLNTDTSQFRDTDVVNYTQIFYWRHFYHADEQSFSAIQRLVFVEGIDEPVINEPYQAQKPGPNGQLVGVTQNPIRILTLTYISDDSLPPSDSSIGRFQVDELEASRDAMVQQRKHSIPIRWFDTNRIAGGTRSLLEKGTYQGFIPSNGPGDRAIGEVARASFPAERFEFDSIIKSDLTEIWQTGTNQAGAFASGQRSAAEAKIVQQNFQTRVGQERDKVTKFFVGIAKVLAGHLSLYGTFDVPDALGIAREALSSAFTYSVRSDSTVRLDAQQRIDQLQQVLNLTAQSGFVNPGPIIAEIVELSGLDPSSVVIQPQPKPPEPVKISVSTAADLHDPLVMALLFATHQAPGPDNLQAAFKLEQTATANMTQPIPQPMPAPAPDGGPVPPQGVARPDMAHSGWDAAPRLDQRQEDGGA